MLRIFIDTNVIISAVLFPDSVPARAYTKAVCAPNEAIVSDQVVDEMQRIFLKKFPHRLAELDAFVDRMLLVVKVVSTPEKQAETEACIRDTKDRPILRAALSVHADILLTGDKDFLQSGLNTPRILNPASFCLLQPSQ